MAERVTEDLALPAKELSPQYLPALLSHSLKDLPITENSLPVFGFVLLVCKIQKLPPKLLCFH